MFKIAGIQLKARPSKEENIERAYELSERAIAEGARIILLGELFSSPWILSEYSQKNYIFAEKIPGESTRPFISLAKKYKITFICPIIEEGDIDGIFYNTAVIISDTGKIIGKYRKVHLSQIDGWNEKQYFAKGDLGLPVFETKWAKFGILMGWDNFFPEAARVLALKGANILLCPTTAAFNTHEIWETIIKANSICNNLFCFRLNRVGSEQGLDFYGKSFCTNPYGELLFIPSTASEGIVIAEIITCIQKTLRGTWSFIKDREPANYLPIMPDPLHGLWEK